MISAAEVLTRPKAEKRLDILKPVVVQSNQVPKVPKKRGRPKMSQETQEVQATPAPTATAEKIKAVRSYYDFDLNEKKIEVEEDFVPAASLEEVMERSNDPLEAANIGLKTQAQRELGKRAESRMPADAISQAALDSVYDPLVSGFRANGKELKEAREMAWAKIKSSEGMKTAIRAVHAALKS